MSGKVLVVEEVVELPDGSRHIGNSFEVSEAEAFQRVRSGGWKLQGLPIGELPKAVAAAGVKGDGRD